jgi:hypothetical protein
MNDLQKFDKMVEMIEDGASQNEQTLMRRYTYDALKAAFQLVENKKDWKAPIESYVTTDEVKIVAEAIKFFTATVAHFDYIGIYTVTEQPLSTCRFQPGVHIMKVRADGYRKGPAGDQD